MSRRKTVLAGILLIAGILVPSSAWACPSCYGAADSAVVDGMNMAILAMLGITGCVLGAISTFFLVMRRRIRRLASGTPREPYVNERGILEWNNS